MSDASYDPNAFNWGGSPNPLSGSGINLAGVSPATLALFGMGGANTGSSSPFGSSSGLGSTSAFSAPMNGASSLLGWNMPTMQLGLSGLGTLGSLFAGFGSLGVANKQLALSTQMANANLQNQTQAYNTNLADRENVRAAWEGLSPAQAQQYITANSLKQFKIGG